MVDSVEVVKSSSFDSVSLTECGDEVSSEETMGGAVALALALVYDSSLSGFDGDSG